jgi:predicted N-acetyltransferase YhbS
VDPAHQNRRIGTGLVAHATAHLRSHGVTRCHVGWLVRTSFYEFLGFSPWRSYQVFDAHGMSV